MDTVTIEERVKRVIVDSLDVKPEKVTHSAHFIKDLGSDSLQHVGLIMCLETEFEKELPGEIPESDAVKLMTLGQVSEYIQQAALPKRGSSLAAELRELARQTDMVSLVDQERATQELAVFIEKLARECASDPLRLSSRVVAILVGDENPNNRGLCFKDKYLHNLVCRREALADSVRASLQARLGGHVQINVNTITSEVFVTFDWEG